MGCHFDGYIAVAAHTLIVTRVGGDDGEDVGGQMIRQVFSIPKALAISAGVMALLGIIPGMPHLVFLLIAACCGYAAWYMQKLANEKVAMASVPVEDPTLSPGHNQEASWEDLQPVDQLGLEVGYRLISLVDKGQDGELLKRIKAIRKKFAQDVGFLPPQVHIKDNLEMKPSMYRITVKGVVMGEGDVYPGMHMAINPGHATAVIEGTAAKDPAFGLPAIWIETKNRESAQLSGYTVVDASTVIATHLSQVLHSQAAQLLGRVETMALIEHFSKVLPKLIDDVVPKLVSVAVFQKVLQSLLAEAIHIRDLRTIIEVLAAVAPRTQDPSDLVAACRIALGQSIVQQIYGRTDELRVIALNPDIERMLLNAVSGGDAEFVLEPGLAEMIFQRATELSDQQENAGLPPVLLVPDRLRTPLARLLKRVAPRLRVISHTEIPDTSTIRVESVLGAN